MNTGNLKSSRLAVALLLLLLVVVAAALVRAPVEQARAQESAEPTATPTPERREGYEERLAARIERYRQQVGEHQAE